MSQQSALADPVPGIEIFAQTWPRAVDLPQSDYEANKARYDAAAKALAYRFIGCRLNRAVFTTKPKR